jgi:hypothetical protein
MRAVNQLKSSKSPAAVGMKSSDRDRKREAFLSSLRKRAAAAEQKRPHLRRPHQRFRDERTPCIDANGSVSLRSCHFSTDDKLLQLTRGQFRHTIGFTIGVVVIWMTDLACPELFLPPAEQLRGCGALCGGRQAWRRGEVLEQPPLRRTRQIERVASFPA